MTENLWGELPGPDLSPSPLAILQAQAKLLNELTSGTLVGMVGRYKNEEDPTKLRGLMTIVAPLFDNYRFSAMGIEFNPLAPYPLVVTDLTEEKRYMVENEDLFKRRVSIILTSSKVQQAIGRLRGESEQAKQKQQKTDETDVPF